jgi:hypothetical protein
VFGALLGGVTAQMRGQVLSHHDAAPRGNRKYHTRQPFSVAKASGRRNSEVMMPAVGKKAVWLTVKRSLITIYNDVYDEHLFVFAAGLSYYFVLSLFPLLVSMASLLGYVPIPHLFEQVQEIGLHSL